LVHPGFWLIGLGFELGYLWLLSSNARFRHWVDTRDAAPQRDELAARRQALLDRLDRDDRAAQDLTEERCRQVVELHAHQAGADDPAVRGQAEALTGLAWVHLRLLVTRASLRQLVRDASQGDDLATRLQAITAQRDAPGISDELRRSFGGQIEILEGRLREQQRAREQLAFVEAEIERLRQQVELAREQALANAGADTASRSIDVLGATVRDANAWITSRWDELPRSGLPLSERS
jgi:hypothetical protein